MDNNATVVESWSKFGTAPYIMSLGLPQKLFEEEGRTAEQYLGEVRSTHTYSGWGGGWDFETSTRRWVWGAWDGITIIRVHVHVYNSPNPGSGHEILEPKIKWLSFYIRTCTDTMSFVLSWLPAASWNNIQGIGIIFCWKMNHSQQCPTFPQHLLMLDTRWKAWDKDAYQAVRWILFVQKIPTGNYIQPFQSWRISNSKQQLIL